MSNKPDYYINTNSVRNEIKKVIAENERFVLGRSDKTEVYAGEVALTQLRRLLRTYENCLGSLMVPFIKGKWLGDGLGIWCCSYCGYKAFGYNKTPYCPNCGADMREEEVE